MSDITAAGTGGGAQVAQAAGTVGLPGFGEDGEWEFAPGSVKGYRQWRLISEDGQHWRLVGMHGHHWSAGWQEAQCLSEWRVKPTPHGMAYPVFTGRHPEVPPVEACGCGFWAYHEPPRPDTAMAAQIVPGGGVITSRAVTGVIEGAGRVITGTRGFRCQRARITAFLAPEIRNLTALYVAHLEYWPPAKLSFTEPGEPAGSLREHAGILPWELEAQTARFLSTFGVPAVTSLDALRPYAGRA